MNQIINRFIDNHINVDIVICHVSVRIITDDISYRYNVSIIKVADAI